MRGLLKNCGILKRIKIYKVEMVRISMGKEKINSKKIIEKLEKEKDKISEQGVKKIGVFGSFAKGKEKAESDIDIIVEFDEITADNYFNLLFLLEKIFKKKIDLVTSTGLRRELSYVKKEAEYAKL